MGEGEGGDGEVGGAWHFLVKCTGHKGSVKVTTSSVGARVSDVCEALEGPTGVPARGQTLIVKGTVLRPPAAELASLGVRGGTEVAPTKLMMVAAKGIVAGPTTAAARARPASPGVRPPPSLATTPSVPAPPPPPPRPKAVPKTAAETWRATGVVALRDSGHRELPVPELRAVGDRARTLDASGNALVEVTGEVLDLVPRLKRLNVSGNALVAVSLPVLPSLDGLQVVDLDGNLLRELPEALGMLPKLRHLSARRNRLEALPGSLGALTGSLEVLLVGDNLLEALPASLAECPRLEEVHAEATYVASIPDTFADAPRLRVLNLDNTRVASVPPSLLLKCTSLATLSLHGAVISKDAFQRTEGFHAYEERRKRKVDKQLAAGMQFDSGFDEGVDPDRFIRNRSKDGGQGPR